MNDDPEPREFFKLQPTYEEFADFSQLAEETGRQHHHPQTGGDEGNSVLHKEGQNRSHSSFKRMENLWGAV